MFAKVSLIVTLLASSAFGLLISSTSTSVAPVPTGPYVQLHPGGKVQKCLDVKDNARANGTPVQVFDCNKSTGQNWIINGGSTQIRLAGTIYCLDATLLPLNYAPVVIWECKDNYYPQQWYYDGDKHIELVNKGQCLDLLNGDPTNGNRVETYRCLNTSPYQVWTVASAGKA